MLGVGIGLVFSAIVFTIYTKDERAVKDFKDKKEKEKKEKEKAQKEQMEKL